MNIKQYLKKYGYEKKGNNELNIAFENCVVLGPDKTSNGEVKVFKLDDLSDEERMDVDFQNFIKELKQ